MTLDAQFGLSRGALSLDVSLRVPPGETLAIVGPNGAGKTSCLLAIAGLLCADRGTIRLGGEVLDGGPGGPFVPPERRCAGFVFQDHLLFPHLTVLDNVAFGLVSRGESRRRARAIAAEWIERVGMRGKSDARPASLSGGEGQRVALARALASSPRLLLLDEPLAAVDASARLALRSELRAHLSSFGGVRLAVAHTAVDAFALGDRIAVVENGRIVQTGTAAEICEKPRSRYVADLVGLNFLRGRAADGVVEVDGGGRLVVAHAGRGPVLLTVHPRAVALFRERPEGSPRNVWQATVEALEPTLDIVRVQLGGPVPLVAEITQAAVADLRLAAGASVWVAVKATEIAASPA
jgi:molybdate transport system ATP-binding protein